MIYTLVLLTVVLIVPAFANDEQSFHTNKGFALTERKKEMVHHLAPIRKYLKPSNETYSLVRHIVDDYLGECNIVYVSGGRSRWKSDSFLRTLCNRHRSYVIFEANASTIDQSDISLNKLHKGEEKETCRVFIFDMMDTKNPSSVLKFMKRLDMYLIPRATVLIIGSESNLQIVLGDSSLVNTANALYLVDELVNEENQALINTKQSVKGHQPLVSVYSRCLFCNQSGPGIQFINFWNSKNGLLRSAPLFKDQFRDFQGHEMQIVQMSWYPLVGYEEKHCDGPNVVTPVDSINMRILKAIARALNFTYEMRNPWDCHWGISTESGNWTGMVGTLQHHKADFGLAVTYNFGRMKVVDYTRIIYKEPLVLVTSKARPPPQYLAIIRPLTVDLWNILAVLSVSAGVILWGLQIAWERVSGRPRLAYDICTLYTWSTLFEEPASKLPNNTSSLLFVGSWCIFCTFMTAMYKSSLIAYLSVPGRTDSIDSFEEMLEDGGWTWGYQDNNSNPYDLLQTSTSPIIKQIFKELQIQPNEDQIEKLLKGKHALIVKEFLFKSLGATMRRIRRGVSPFHYGELAYLANGDGWGFRQNAPFYDAIDLKLQRMVETGHVDRWRKDLVGTTQEESCDDSKCDADTEDEASEGIPQETSGQVVLNLNHLQSAFYVFLLGLAVASLAFAIEVLYRKTSSSKLQVM